MVVDDEGNLPSNVTGLDQNTDSGTEKGQGIVAVQDEGSAKV